MTEYVFRPSRNYLGRRVKSRLYSGRYSIGRGERPKTVSLHTADRAVAVKRLRQIVTDAQREREGMIPPSSQREAARWPLVVLLADYRNDLCGRGLKTNHVKESVRRIELMTHACNWRMLADITPASFVAFRASQEASAKTKKEYQISVNAWLNWLVRVGRLAANPLAHVDRIDTRGKQVRPTRAFTEAELSALFGSCGERALFYRFLTYTGCRYNEAARLVREDFSAGCRAVVIRAENAKGKRERSVPVRDELAWEFAMRLAAGSEVFPYVPTYEVLLADLVRAGIERKDERGRVVHFHAFRKTFQTWGARSGVGQRSAQAILGHTDPALTANVYTDEQALLLASEVAKLPWIGGVKIAHEFTHTNARKPAGLRPFDAILRELVEAAKALPESELAEIPAASHWLPGMGSNHWRALRAFYKSAQIDAQTQAEIEAVLILSSLAGGRCSSEATTGGVSMSEGGQ